MVLLLLGRMNSFHRSFHMELNSVDCHRSARFVPAINSRTQDADYEIPYLYASLSLDDVLTRQAEDPYLSCTLSLIDSYVKVGVNFRVLFHLSRHTEP